jgi:serine/threonine protein kinase
MSAHLYPVRLPLASDAPLLAELVGLGDGRAGLKRRLDPVFATDSRIRDAFLAEIRALGRIATSSLFLVPLVDAEDEGDPWLVREYSEEGTVETRVRQGPPLSGGELLTILEALLSGLEELGRLGLAHGDPSPANLLVTMTGRVRLADAVSSRRAFAVRLAEEEDPAGRDRERAMFWLARLASSAAAHDPLAAELRRALSTGSSEVRLVRARRLAEDRASARRPLERPASGPEPIRLTAPTPVAVVVSIGPLLDPRVAYQTARAVADATREPLASVRRELESTAKIFETRWPDPARAVVDLCARLGVTVDVRAAGSEGVGR